MLSAKFASCLCIALLTAQLSAIPAARAQTANPTMNTVLSDSDRKALDDFSKRVKDYVSLRDAGPKLKQTTDISKLHEQRNELKKSIRSRRPDAKQGDIFTPEASAIFTKLLAQAFNGPKGPAIRQTLLHAEPVNTKEGSRRLKINGGFPNQLGEPLQSTPASLLENLPMLPKDVEYRLVGRALVLRDAESNIIIDYLPDAIPPITPQ